MRTIEFLSQTIQVLKYITIPGLFQNLPDSVALFLDNDLKPSIFPSLNAWYTSTLHSLSTTSTTTFDQNPNSDLHDKSGLLHVYRTVFNGFSASLTAHEADALRTTPGVLSVIRDQPRQLHTTRTPQFLGLVSGPTSQPNSLISSANAGAGIVVAVLDTGIDPTHRSFSAAGQPNPPSKWKGSCQAGPSFPATSCNNKLVGARFFATGFKAGSTPKNSSTDILSPYDTNGHGTHTASTIAGCPADRASFFGFATGVATGIAPRAHVAVYKICWSSGCFESDILAAFDNAVEDGADIISLSVGGGPTPYHLDSTSIGAFSALNYHGVLVSASSGNDGPGAMTATNIAPWITTVGASTIDRRFPADVTLGDGTVLSGASLYSGKDPSVNKWLPLVYAGNLSSLRLGFRSSAPFCMRGSLDPAATRGKVVLCERGVVKRAEKGLAVKEAGGVGMIISNQFLDGEGVVPDAHLLPAVDIGFSEGKRVHDYIHTAASPTVRLSFHGTQIEVKPAPVVASFSGRGPSAQSAFIIKPDIIAPGVGIIAAWTNSTSPTELLPDERRTEFNILSGTSMSCPHVSGIAALLKAAHPDWSPAAIRSAIMTTAYVNDNLGRDLLDESTGNRSIEWAHGSGHIDPERAADPGLVYELSTDDYTNFLCSSNYTELDIRTITRTAVNCSQNSSKPWDLNYPSISIMMNQPVPTTSGNYEIIVHRTLTSVRDTNSTYMASMKEPSGVHMVIVPDKLVFSRKGEKQQFVVKISANASRLQAGASRTEFGYISWTDGERRVRSPVAFTWHQSF
ncbi:Subtilisin-like protease [Rhynchospora pubera]|uniref:Subtilisin-like protease n=1 Tax=Rhynchospora pubera TaxID=906938 RepID=A0AAV8C3G7_9POAL|nr:Subtilisin-like protease [Rhynchospora pubera]